MACNSTGGQSIHRPGQPRPAAPWQQAGSPLVRVAPTGSTIHPFMLRVGDHDTIEVPMTAAALRSLHTALTALLTTTTPAEPADFVADWARAHGASVRDAAPQPENPEPASPVRAPIVALAPPRVRADPHGRRMLQQLALAGGGREPGP